MTFGHFVWQIVLILNFRSISNSQRISGSESFDCSCCHKQSVVEQECRFNYFALLLTSRDARDIYIFNILFLENVVHKLTIYLNLHFFFFADEDA